MSYEIVDAVFRIKLPRAEKQVLQALASFASNDGSGAWPSIHTLVQFTQLSERGVQDALRALEKRNYIVAESSKAGGKHAQTVRYRILIPNADVVRAVKHPAKEGTGAIAAPVEGEGCSDCTPTGAIAAPTGAVTAGTGAVGAPKSDRESAIESASFEKVKTSTPTTTNPEEGVVVHLQRAYLQVVGMSLLVGKHGDKLTAMLVGYSPATIDAAVAEWNARRSAPAKELKHPASVLPKELPEWLAWAKQHELENTVTPEMDTTARARKLEQLGLTEEEFAEMEQQAKE
jgi:hypothetical protein